MGCVPCGDVSTVYLSLTARIRQPVLFLRTWMKKETLLSQFISQEDLKQASMIQNDIIAPSFIQHHFQISKCLLTPQRRSLWKISVAYSTFHVDIKPYKYVNNPLVTPPSSNEIDLDIKRTFPQHELDQNALCSVLRNIVLYFPGVGYTQGMNFIVGFFLLCGFTGSQSFWLFIRLSFDPRFLLARNFSEGFFTVFSGINLINKRLTQQNSLKVLSLIESLGLNSYFYSFQWVLSLFIYNMTVVSSTVLWDCLLLAPCQKPCPQYASLGGGLLFLVPFAVLLFQQIASEVTDQESVRKLSRQSIKENISPNIVARLVSQSHSLLWEDYIKDLKEIDQEMYAIAMNWNGSQEESIKNKANYYYQKCYNSK